MLPAIDLDDELALQTCEVDDVRTDRDLAPEPRTESLKAELPPKTTLRIGHGSAKVACTFGQFFGHRTAPLLASPLLLPPPAQGGGTRFPTPSGPDRP